MRKIEIETGGLIIPIEVDFTATKEEIDELAYEIMEDMFYPHKIEVEWREVGDK